MLYGRDREAEQFQQLLNKKKASLIVCQGRRRIGKSTFVRSCAEKAGHFLWFEGLAPREGIGSMEQLGAFAEQLVTQTKAPRLPLGDWTQAFQLLDSLLPQDGKSVVVLLDEISWMAAGEPDFAGRLKVAWDNLFSRRQRLVLVLCGSVSSWITENILNNTGFVGRCSQEFHLGPLMLPFCSKFWGKRAARICAMEKLKVLAVTGGVPRYLEEINPARTAEQVVEGLCFTKGALLLREFDQIFHDIFSRRAESYREIVRVLAEGRRSVMEISRELGRERGGSLSEALEELCLAGFVRKDVPFDPVSGEDLPRAIGYRLSDNYLRFFLKYVEPVQSRIERGLYQRTPLESLMVWDTVMGLQCENLLLENVPVLMERVGLGNVAVLNAAPYVQRQTLRRKGCQVDLMIRTRQSLYVFEVKFRKTITVAVVGDVREKVARLKVPKTLSVRTGLVYAGELDAAVPESEFFDFLVPFERLLE